MADFRIELLFELEDEVGVVRFSRFDAKEAVSVDKFREVAVRGARCIVIELPLGTGCALCALVG